MYVMYLIYTGFYNYIIFVICHNASSSFLHASIQQQQARLIVAATAQTWAWTHLTAVESAILLELKVQLSLPYNWN